MSEGTYFPNENAKADKVCACPGILSPIYGPHHLEDCPFRLGAMVCDIPTTLNDKWAALMDALDDALDAYADNGLLPGEPKYLAVRAAAIAYGDAVALDAMLNSGKHDGPCTNESDGWDSCELHIAAWDRRISELRQEVKA